MPMQSVVVSYPPPNVRTAVCISWMVESSPRLITLLKHPLAMPSKVIWRWYQNNGKKKISGEIVALNSSVVLRNESCLGTLIIH